MNRTIIYILFLLPLLISCDQATEDEMIQYSNVPVQNDLTTYRLAIHPLHNPKKLFEAYQPLVDHINSHFKNVLIELEASRDYPSYERKFRGREPELLLPNPWQTLQAIREGYHVIAMAGDAKDFKGVFIIRNDNASIQQPIDLKGKVVSYPAKTALAAAIMPQFYLHSNGININSDIENIYVGSQESSIMNVYLQHAVVGATWPPPWRLFQKDHPEKAKQLRVIWQTPALINNSVMVRNDIPEDIARKIQAILIQLDQTEKGRTILAKMETAKITIANNTSYDLVRDYISYFEKTVRLVETP